MDYLASQFTLSLAGYLAAIGMLGLLLGWWLGRGSVKRGARETTAEFEQNLATEREEHEQASLEVARLADQLAQTKVDVEEARVHNSQVQSNLSAAEEQVSVEQQRVASFEPLLAKRDIRLEELRNEQTAHHDRITTLEDDKRQAQMKIEAQASELAKAEARVRELESLDERTRQQAEQLEHRVDENAALGAEVARLTQVEEDFGLWQERAADHEEAIRQTRRQLEDASQERDRVVAELATLSSRLDQAEVERKSHDMAAEAARRELDAQRRELRRRDEQASALENSGAEVPELESEIESLRGELASSVRRVEDLQERVAAAQASGRAAEREREQMGRELEALLSAPLIDVDRMATAKPVILESADDDAPTSAPELLEVPRGAADDLERIRGIGKVLAETLHSLGIYHFSQIASWSESDIQWVAAHINTFPDRIMRDEWREQAAQLDLEKQSRQV